MTQTTPAPALSAADRFACFISAAENVFMADKELLHATKTALLDCVSATLSGTREPVVAKLLAEKGLLSPGEATIIGGLGKRLPVDAAVLVNGTMGHATDYDDVSFSMWGHATAPVFAAVLATCERLDVSGFAFLRAFLIGLEVEMKIGKAVAPHHYGLGWHATSSIGIFGACAGAAAALSLTTEQTVNALSIAASRAAGLRANFGSMTKAMHVGFAGRDGLEAALLAAQGITGQKAALDGAFGFIHTLAGGQSLLPELMNRIGAPFEIVDPGLAYKLYPSCSDTHIAVDALLDLTHAEGISIADVDKIRCGVTQSVYDNLSYHAPRTGLEGKFSLEFCLARALSRGGLTLDDFTDENVRDGTMVATMNRIDVFADSTIPEGAFCSPAYVALTARNGAVHQRLGTSARGHTDRPLSCAQMREKFENCAKCALSVGQSTELFEIIETIEKAPSIRQFTRALSGAPQ